MTPTWYLPSIRNTKKQKVKVFAWSGKVLNNTFQLKNLLFHRSFDTHFIVGKYLNFHLSTKLLLLYFFIYYFTRRYTYYPEWISNKKTSLLDNNSRKNISFKNGFFPKIKADHLKTLGCICLCCKHFRSINLLVLTQPHMLFLYIENMGLVLFLDLK